MTMTMLARVQQAIWDATITDDDGSVDTTNCARAAVEAMREPTEAMVDVGDKLADPDYLYADMEPTRNAWSAMIDAALAEDPATT